MGEIYLDNCATTKPLDEVIQIVARTSSEYFGNPSSLHRKGLEAEKQVLNARKIIAGALSCKDKEIFFTSGGTESNNLAIRGFLLANPRRGKTVISIKTEHPSILETLEEVKKLGIHIEYIPVDTNGIIDLNVLEERISDDTALITVSAVNNETGAIQPLEKISAIRKSKNPNTALHVDGIQAFGKINIKPKKLGIDLYSISSHKIHGPKGIAALYRDDGIRIDPILFGGKQEGGIRSGTENVPAIVGLGTATEIAYVKIDENFEKVKKLKMIARDRISRMEFQHLIISGQESSPYIINVSFQNVKGEVLLHMLEERRIYISTGAACSSKRKVHSHVLKSINIDEKWLDGAIRISFSPYSTEEEVQKAMDAIQEIVPIIQRLGRKR